MTTPSARGMPQFAGMTDGMQRLTDWILGCRPQQVRRRMVARGWIASCCRCERNLPGHSAECRNAPDYLCRACTVDYYRGEAS